MNIEFFVRIRHKNQCIIIVKPVSVNIRVPQYDVFEVSSKFASGGAPPSTTYLGINSQSNKEMYYCSEVEAQADYTLSDNSTISLTVLPRSRRIGTLVEQQPPGNSSQLFPAINATAKISGTIFVMTATTSSGGFTTGEIILFGPNTIEWPISATTTYYSINTVSLTDYTADIPFNINPSTQYSMDPVINSSVFTSFQNVPGIFYSQGDYSMDITSYSIIGDGSTIVAHGIRVIPITPAMTTAATPLQITSSSGTTHKLTNVTGHVYWTGLFTSTYN